MSRALVWLVASLVGRIGETAMLVVPGARGVSAFEPGTGKLRWECAWEEGRSAACVAFGRGRVFASRTLPEAEVVAVEGAGAEPTSREALWNKSAGATDVPSPIWSEGKVYLLGDKGVLTCLEDQAGEVRWKLRLPGSYSASPVLASGRLYWVNEQGLTVVVVLDDPGRIVGRNPLEEPVFATPIPAARRWYFRTESHLLCNVNAMHRVSTMYHLINISIRLGGRALRWDVDAEEVRGDAEANAILSRPQRAPSNFAVA